MVCSRYEAAFDSISSPLNKFCSKLCHLCIWKRQNFGAGYKGNRRDLLSKFLRPPAIKVATSPSLQSLSKSNEPQVANRTKSTHCNPSSHVSLTVTPDRIAIMAESALAAASAAAPTPGTSLLALPLPFPKRTSQMRMSIDT